MQAHQSPLARQSDHNGACRQHAPYIASVIVITVIVLSQLS